VQDLARKLGLAVGVCMIGVAVGFTAASARDATPVSVATAHAQAPVAESAEAGQSATPQHARLPYYVDFRARTAASYGHAFIWYGRTGERKVEVAGLHPATDSVVPYILGHVIPVPAETGASYGDLDEDYLQATYRVYLTEAQARAVFAYIKRKQANSPVWNAATYNCVVFISDIAQFMGMRVPGSHLLYPEDWVKQLAALNRGRKTVQFSLAQ
jgi:hypothetical protein